MNELIQWDQQAFLAINNGWASPVLDLLLPPARNMYVWAPLYIFFVAWFSLNFGKKGWQVIGLIILTFALTDILSSHLIKPWIGRLRPCNDAGMQQYVRLLVGCGGGNSFTSSHAANHFGFALFVGLVTRPYFRGILTILLTWAGTIALAQVYVGVHYPLDIVGGSMLGCISASVVYMLYKSKFKLPQ
ncbi:MAG: phosphatase PAP2 family protein [Bacteroidia bacterium]|jgi:membrane-associated phospholipid phosphatase